MTIDTKLRILIGGAPSTGSSLFRQILNRHPEVFCGPETYLFIHPEIYNDWHHKKHLLTANRLGPLLKNRGLSCDSMFFYPKVELNKKEIGNTAGRARLWVRKASSFQDFSDRFFQTPLKFYNKRIWAEKSPANARCFDLFIHHFEGARVIHMIRDPYDSIASLLHRGLSLFFAVSVYLFNTAFALQSRKSPFYLELRYEELTEAPGRAVRDLLQSMGLNYHSEMLQPGNPEMTEISKMNGWRFDETDHVRKDKTSRFSMLQKEEQDAVKVAVNSIQFDQLYAWKNGIDILNMEQVARELKYPLFNTDHIDARTTISRLRSEMSVYYKKRLSSLNFTFFKNKPIVLSQ